MFNEIVVTMDGQSNPPRFQLTEGGLRPRVASVAVIDVGAERPVWWLVPASFTAVPFTMGEVTAEHVDALADGEPIDPIEDLSPSDPRHQEAIAVRESLVSAFPELGAVTYGVVPDGFRQTTPERGVTALVPGQSYNLVVMSSGGHGGIVFEVDENGTGRRPTMRCS